MGSCLGGARGTFGMTAHSKLGASNAHRWLACSGSVNAEKDISDSTSPFAEEGTRAHDLAELALTTSDTALDAFADQEMAGFVRVYTDYVRQLSAGSDLTLIEQRVDYSPWVPGGFGTADAIILRGNTLHVVDLKYGRGVQVFADNNPQAMLYALGAYNEIGHIADIQTIHISIVQPRLDHISEWEIDLDALLRWAEWVTQRAEVTQADDAPRSPGEAQCRFCKAKAACKALADHVNAVLMTDFDAMDELVNPDTMTDAQIAKALEAKPLIDGWLNAVTAHVTDRLEAGNGFPGFKLVAGRTSRRWDDDDAAKDALTGMIGDDAVVTKVISPAQAEKILGTKRKADIADMIITSPGKPTLAPESDKRPTINASIDDFQVVND